MTFLKKNKASLSDLFKDYLTQDGLDKLKSGELFSSNDKPYVTGKLTILAVWIEDKELEMIKERSIQISNVILNNHGFVASNFAPLIIATFDYPMINHSKSVNNCLKSISDIKQQTGLSCKIVYGCENGMCGIDEELLIFTLMVENFDHYMGKLVSLPPNEIYHIRSS